MAQRRRLMRRLAHEFAELDFSDKRTDIWRSKNHQVIYCKPA